MMFSKFFPIVYVHNLTNSTIEKIHFKFEGMRSDILIKKIKVKSIKSEAIITKGAKEETKLIMYYYDEHNNKHEHIIFDKLVWGYDKDIKIDIIGINEDNSYKLKIETDVIDC